MAWPDPFRNAELLLLASQYSGSGDLLDKSGNGHDATPSGATFLSHDGTTNYVWQPHNASVENVVYHALPAAITTTPTQIELEITVAFDDLTPAATSWLTDIATTPTITTQNIGLYVQSDGVPRVKYLDGNPTTRLFTVDDSLATVGFTVGVFRDIRIVMAGLNTTTMTVDFYWREVGDTAWTPWGAQESDTIVAGHAAGSDTVRIGGDAAPGAKVSACKWVVDGVEIVNLTSSDIEPSRTALDLNGTGDYASVPDEATFTPSSTLSVRWVGTADDWTAASQRELVGHWVASGNQRSWVLELQTGSTGKIKFNTSDNGATGFGESTSSVANAFADGAVGGIRADWDSAGTVDFFVSNDAGATWLPLGTQQTDAKTSLHNSTQPLEIGSANAGTLAPWLGQVHSVTVIADGTTVLDVDFTDQTPGAATITAETGQTVTLNSDAAIVPDGQLRIHDSTGNVWTVNRATSGYMTTLVEQPLFVLDGTDDYLEVAHHADLNADNDFTAILALRRHNTPAANKIVMAKRDNVAGTDEGWSMLVATTDNAAMEISDGATEAFDAFVDGNLPVSAQHAFALRLDTVNDEIETFVDGVGTGSPTSTTLTESGTGVLRIGASSTGVSDADMEFYAAAIWNRALSDAEIATANTLLQAGPLSLTGLELGDLSEADVAELASLAGVTLTSGEIVGQLNEIAGTTGSEYKKALIAAAAAAGVTYP